jgi:ankyrin repeat protein
MIELLISNNANLNRLDKYGQTCLFYSVIKGHLKTVELLTNYGADINVIDNKKKTPLAYAYDNNHKDIIMYLEAKGATQPQSRKKNNKSRSKSQLDMSNISNMSNVESTSQKTERYIFMTIDSEGNDTPMSNEQLYKFLESNPKIKKLLSNQLPR